MYRTRDSKLGRDVALKAPHDALANDPDYMARFPARSAGSLNHPYIAQIDGLEGNAIAMELVEGEELRGPLPFDEASPIVRQIAEALEAAHDRGIVHRDLKPANIKVTPTRCSTSDSPRQSKRQPRPSAPTPPTLTIRATQAGIILGAAGYMGPSRLLVSPPTPG